MQPGIAVSLRFARSLRSCRCRESTSWVSELWALRTPAGSSKPAPTCGWSSTRPGRERYRAEPTVVNGRPYRFALLDDDIPADLVIVAVKHPQLGEAIELLRPGVGRDTVVLSLLNGIGSEDRLRAGLPGAPRAVRHHASASTPSARDGTCGTPRWVASCSARRPTPIRPPPQSAGSPDCSPQAGIPHVVPADMLHELWWKFLINVGANQVSASGPGALPGAAGPRPAGTPGDDRCPARGHRRGQRLAASRSTSPTSSGGWTSSTGSAPTTTRPWRRTPWPDGRRRWTSSPAPWSSSARRTGVPVPVNATLYGLLKGAEAVLRRCRSGSLPGPVDRVQPEPEPGVDRRACGRSRRRSRSHVARLRSGRASCCRFTALISRPEPVPTVRGGHYRVPLLGTVRVGVVDVDQGEPGRLPGRGVDGERGHRVPGAVRRRSSEWRTRSASQTSSSQSRSPVGASTDSVRFISATRSRCSSGTGPTHDTTW